MENTIYEWLISSMKCQINEGILNNVVISIHWRLTALRDGKVAEVYTLTSVPVPTVGNFTPYEELTKEQVVSWIVAELSIIPEPIDGIEQPTELDKIKEILNLDIDLQLNPIYQVLDLPF